MAQVKLSDHRKAAFGHTRHLLKTLLLLTLSLTSTYSRADDASKIKINGETRSKVIDIIITKLNDAYVFPDVAKTMALALRTHEARNDYNTMSDPNIFAAALTRDLRAVSHDKHLEVHFTAAPSTEQKQAQEIPIDLQKDRQSENCGFDEAKHLPGNIGYIKFVYFGDPAFCEFTATAALNFIAYTEAVILDLRENGGGSAGMVDFIATYFFAKPMQLSSLYFRENDFTQERWTRTEVAATRLVSQPLYILTSSKTFSAAESFAYDMQSLKRATIVGEITGGGAHPLRTEPVYADFYLNVPFARAINPITHTDWEGTGVIPDISVPADQALLRTLNLIKDKSDNTNRPSSSFAPDK